MTRLELLNKSDELTTAWMDKQAKLDNYVQRWLNGEVQMGVEGMQQLVDNASQQIEQLKSQAAQFQKEYMKVAEEEAMRKNAVISVRNNFGVSPDEIIITGGVLSSNANESHLEGRNKTPEELEIEKMQLLASVREKVTKKEISLAEASNLVQKINIAYNSTLYEQENTQGEMKR